MTAIWIVADDYGISPSVNAAIRDLLAAGRISGTSVMVVAPAFTASETRALAAIAHDGKRPAIGLHVTLTAPFKPLTTDFRPLRAGSFRSLGQTALAALLRRIDRTAAEREIRAQLAAFVAAFGRPPDFVDGHQHVHLLPGIAEALIGAVRDAAPDAWVRQCGRAPEAASRETKPMLLDAFSRRFRRRAAAQGVRTNPVFSGAYAFHAGARFAELFPMFLSGMRDGGVIMCHPGKVDATLRALDPLTTLREKEYEYFGSDAYPALLQRRGITLLP
ncbi:MAG TPA: ChbG/HpnK family deacetylase [Xanthobacteraceae bacterium]|nr:ChbG/HpnK family deacetylase [Xanthobacteraceae bacterium]